MSEPVAAIDCGTNSIRLLVAEFADGRLVDLTREMRIVRLGQDVDRTGRLAAEAIERTRGALLDYAATIERLGAVRVRMVATSATRDAANRDEFVAMVASVLGIEPEVITGAEEARLSFQGAVSGLPALAARGIDGPDRASVLVADIGGGSTEVVLGSPDGQLRAYSMDVGCVRLTERHLHDDPPTADQIAATLADIDAALAVAAEQVPLRSGGPFVGVAGTVTTLAGLVQELPAYDSARIHGSTMTAAQVHGLTEALLQMPRQQRAALPVMHPGRVDVIAAGALVLDRLMVASGAPEVIASEHDILDGIARSLR